MQRQTISEQEQVYVQEQQFMILQALSPQEQMRLNEERRKQLELFYRTNKQYEISSWYKQLQEFTFKSVSMELTSIDAYVLYWLYYNDQDITKLQTKHEQLYTYYIKLLKKVDQFLNTHNQTLNKDAPIKCFMKLSTRSPKDLGYKYLPHQTQTISHQLTSNLKLKYPQYTKNQTQTQNNHQMHVYQNSTSQYTVQQNTFLEFSKQFLNQIYRFFLDLSKNKFKITSSQDFINIFSSSQRIIIDISDLSYLKGNIFEQFQKGNYQKAQDEFIELWARQWDDFEWYEQFRCFYHNYKLTAITQYDQRCYFPQIQSKFHIIKSQIIKFFDSMLVNLQRLGLSEGVMDLVLFGIGDQKVKQVKLIEINVFNRNSRASLFSWENDKDILNSEIIKQPQIRILQEPIKISKYQLIKLMGMIDKGKQQIIQLSMKNLSLSQMWNNFQ